MKRLDRSINAASETGSVQVKEARIHFESWGEENKPGVIFIHGSNAHLEWWRIIAPFLTAHFRVAALDLSGAGDSAWRKQYSGALFAEEVLAVCKAAKLGPNPYVIGHSFGGMVALESGHLYGDQLGGIILMDFTIRPEHSEDDIHEFRKQLLSRPSRPTRVYHEKKQVLERFRLVPEQSCKNSALLDYIAEKSIRQVEGGWTWKFDPDMFRNLDLGSKTKKPGPNEKYANLVCKKAFIMGEESLDYSEASLLYTQQLTRGRVPMVTIPDTSHHLMFDEPAALVSAISGILLEWENNEQ